MMDSEVQNSNMDYDSTEGLSITADSNDTVNQDIEALVRLLDGCTQAEESRIKIDVVEGQGEIVSRKYHHGRCDVGSPWACGAAFDVLE